MKKLATFITLLFASSILLFSQTNFSKKSAEGLIFRENMRFSYGRINKDQYHRKFILPNQFNSKLIHQNSKLSNVSHRLDSIVWQDFNSLYNLWENSEKYEYYYDTVYNTIRIVEFWYNDSEMKWDSASLQKNVYDDNGKIIEESFYNLNEEEVKWEKSFKEEYFYDEEGNLVGRNDSWYDSNNVWYDNFQYITEKKQDAVS